MCASEKKALEVDLSHGTSPVRKIMSLPTGQDSLKYVLQRLKTLFRCCIGAKLVNLHDQNIPCPCHVMVSHIQESAVSREKYLLLLS